MGTLCCICCVAMCCTGHNFSKSEIQGTAEQQSNIKEVPRLLGICVNLFSWSGQQHFCLTRDPRPKGSPGNSMVTVGTLFFFFFNFIYLFIYLFMAVLGLRFCARAFSSCGKWGPLFIAVRRPLSIAASLVAEHRPQTCRLSNCGSRA